MRSLSEIRFRLAQELANVRFFAIPPRLPQAAAAGIQAPFPALPDPADITDRLKTTPFAVECVRIANEILGHRFPLLGVMLETGPDIAWRRDYVRGIETKASYFRRIPYLDVARAGDHKLIWEINRHQHLVLLAQAYRLSGRKDFLAEIERQIESWLAQNPFQRGINWASALEVAFRALSWIWIYHLAGNCFGGSFRFRFLEGLYRHGLHLEVNLSYYFSPNTHLLGEAVALDALGRLFPQFPSSSGWRETAARVVRNELDRQVLADGCHFERSTYYHVYAVDMFLFHTILRGPDDPLRDIFRSRLTQMAVFLDALIGSTGVLPFFGDDDGGRFFHPYGPRNRFGLATLATCGEFLDHPEWIRDRHNLEEQAVWWLKKPEAAPPPVQQQAASESIRFADSGLVVMTGGEVEVIVDTGPFGPGTAGHSHSDTLSLVLRRCAAGGAEQILVDPGTYTYVSERVWRERFRGTAAHNTIRIDGLDQAIPNGPFAWQSRPEVELLGWETSPDRDIVAAACCYAGFRHQRKVVFNKRALWVVVLDHVEGPPGEHRIEQFWHCGEKVRQRSPECYEIGREQAGTQTLISFEAGAEVRLAEGNEYGWISPALGIKEPAPVLWVERRGSLPATMAVMIDLSGKARTLGFRLHADESGADCVYDGGEKILLTWL